MWNPFYHPGAVRNTILKINPLNFTKKKFTGKSLACVFLTRFCNVGCPFCFFKSAPPWRKPQESDQFTNEGIQKLIAFSENANLGYLLVSGGGEPLNQRDHVLELVEKAHADRIVLVTSGNWAKNYNVAETYVHALYDAFKKRKKLTTLVVRLSISEGHAIKLGIDPALNLIKIFQKQFQKEKNFYLQLKSFKNDKILQTLLSSLSLENIQKEPEKLVSDNLVLDKIIPEKYNLSFEDNFSITLGVSKVFLSTLRPDLTDPESLINPIEVVEEDLRDSENDYSTVVFNHNGTQGLNWSIHYNGNVCTWQNQAPDNWDNLYDSTYAEISEKIFSDPLTYSVIDKGNLYRDRIINEINPKAVIRAKAIGLRDSTGAILFEEEKTALYYTLRVLQDYLHEGKINKTQVQSWPSSHMELVMKDTDELKKLHHQSNYSILSQYINKGFDEVTWYDLLELVKLGHYELTQDQISDFLSIYNTNAINKVEHINAIVPQMGPVERRLTDKLLSCRKSSTDHSKIVFQQASSLGGS